MRKVFKLLVVLALISVLRVNAVSFYDLDYRGKDEDYCNNTIKYVYTHTSFCYEFEYSKTYDEVQERLKSCVGANANTEQCKKDRATAEKDSYKEYIKAKSDYKNYKFKLEDGTEVTYYQLETDKNANPRRKFYNGSVQQACLVYDDVKLGTVRKYIKIKKDNNNNDIKVQEIDEGYKSICDQNVDAVVTNRSDRKKTGFTAYSIGSATVRTSIESIEYMRAFRFNEILGTSEASSAVYYSIQKLLRHHGGINKTILRDSIRTVLFSQTYDISTKLSGMNELSDFYRAVANGNYTSATFKHGICEQEGYSCTFNSTTSNTAHWNNVKKYYDIMLGYIKEYPTYKTHIPSFGTYEGFNTDANTELVELNTACNGNNEQKCTEAWLEIQNVDNIIYHVNKSYSVKNFRLNDKGNSSANITIQRKTFENATDHGYIIYFKPDNSSENITLKEGNFTGGGTVSITIDKNLKALTDLGLEYVSGKIYFSFAFNPELAFETGTARVINKGEVTFDDYTSWDDSNKLSEYFYIPTETTNNEGDGALYDIFSNGFIFHDSYSAGGAHSMFRLRWGSEHEACKGSDDIGLCLLDADSNTYSDIAYAPGSKPDIKSCLFEKGYDENDNSYKFNALSYINDYYDVYCREELEFDETNSRNIKTYAGGKFTFDMTIRDTYHCYSTEIDPEHKILNARLESVKNDIQKIYEEKQYYEEVLKVLSNHNATKDQLGDSRLNLTVEEVKCGGSFNREDYDPVYYGIKKCYTYSPRTCDRSGTEAMLVGNSYNISGIKATPLRLVIPDIDAPGTDIPECSGQNYKNNKIVSIEKYTFERSPNICYNYVYYYDTTPTCTATTSKGDTFKGYRVTFDNYYTGFNNGFPIVLGEMGSESTATDRYCTVVKENVEGGKKISYRIAYDEEQGCDYIPYWKQFEDNYKAELEKNIKNLDEQLMAKAALVDEIIENYNNEVFYFKDKWILPGRISETPYGTYAYLQGVNNRVNGQLEFDAKVINESYSTCSDTNIRNDFTCNKKTPSYINYKVNTCRYKNGSVVCGDENKPLIDIKNLYGTFTREYKITPNVKKFYNKVLTGEIARKSLADEVDTKWIKIDGLPISNNIKVGTYPIEINIERLGYYFDTSTGGRLDHVVYKQGDNCNYNVRCITCPIYVRDCAGKNCDGGGDANFNLIYRVISSYTLDPNSRELGPNWTTPKGQLTLEEIIARSNNDNSKIVGSDYELSVTMTPSMIKYIRRYNKNYENDGGYGNDTLECYSYDKFTNIMCYSTFIDELADSFREEVKIRDISSGAETYVYEGKIRPYTIEDRKSYTLIPDVSKKYAVADYWTIVTDVVLPDVEEDETKVVGPSWK